MTPSIDDPFPAHDSRETCAPRTGHAVVTNASTTQNNFDPAVLINDRRGVGLRTHLIRFRTRAGTPLARGEPVCPVSGEPADHARRRWLALSVVQHVEEMACPPRELASQRHGGERQSGHCPSEHCQKQDRSCSLLVLLVQHRRPQVPLLTGHNAGSLCTPTCPTVLLTVARGPVERLASQLYAGLYSEGRARGGARLATISPRRRRCRFSTTTWWLAIVHQQQRGWDRL